MKCKECNLHICNNNFANCPLKDKKLVPLRCPKCNTIFEENKFDSPYFYCKKCETHYHINLFIKNDAWREMLGLDPLSPKEEKTLDQWVGGKQ